MKIKHLFLLLFFLNLIFALTENKGTVVSIAGIAQYKLPGEDSYHNLSVGKTVYEAYKIRTGRGCILTIKLDDGSQVIIHEFSTMSFKELKKDDIDNYIQYTIRLYSGKIRSKVESLNSSKSSFKIETPQCVNAVRGTDFAIEINNYNSSVYVIEGAVEVKNILNSGTPVIAKANTFTTVGRNTAPTSPRPIPDSFFEAWNIPKPGTGVNSDLVMVSDAPIENTIASLKNGAEETTDTTVSEDSAEQSADTKTEEEEGEEEEKKEKEPKEKNEREKQPWKFSIQNKLDFGIIKDAERSYEFRAFKERIPQLDPYWIKFAWSPTFMYGNDSNGIGLGLYIPIIFGIQKFWYNPGRWYNYYEYDFQKNGNNYDDVFNDIKIKLLFIQLKLFDFYILVGGLSDITYGSGYLVNHFSNMLNFPIERYYGLKYGYNNKNIGIHVSGFIDNINRGRVLGYRGEFNPFVALIKSESKILQGYYIGFSYAQDSDPVHREYLSPSVFKSSFGIDPDKIDYFKYEYYKIPYHIFDELRIRMDTNKDQFNTYEQAFYNDIIDKMTIDVDVKMIGIDTGIPLVATESVSHLIYANLAWLSTPGTEPIFGSQPRTWQYGPGASLGLRGNVLKFLYKTEFLYHKNGFMSEYIDTQYFEPFFQTKKFYELLKNKNNDLLGWFIYSGIALSDLGKIGLAFQEYYDIDTYEYIRNKLRLEIAINKGVFPLFYGTAYYERTSVVGRELLNNLVDKNTILGAEAHIVLFGPLEAVIRYTRTYSVENGYIKPNDIYTFDMSVTFGSGKEKSGDAAEGATDQAAEKATE